MKLRIATYNIHKGVMGLRKPALTIHALREQIHAIDADMVFLQEVQGRHDKYAARFGNWPADAQHDFLSREQTAVDDLLGHVSQRYFSVYGMNAVYPHGHHGNALLSKHEIDWSVNEDVSDHRLESRGLLHCRVLSPAGPVHALVVHFGLLGRSRVRQADLLVRHVKAHVPDGVPMVIAGDFNDWQRKLGPVLGTGLGLQEAVPLAKPGWMGRAQSASFPSQFPVLGLDRVFCRGFKITKADVLVGQQWSKLSDHSPFVVELELYPSA